MNTDFLVKTSFYAHFIFSASAILVAGAVYGAGVSPGVMQPTDPCEVRSCERRVTSAARGVTLASVKLDRNEALISKATECSKAVREYRPKIGRALNESYRDAYLRACFSGMSVVGESERNLIRTSVFRLSVQLDSASRQPCTAVAISNRVIVTARHCFYRTAESRRNRISQDRLDLSEVIGFHNDGTRFRVVGWQVIFDPAANLQTSGLNAQVSDFVLLSPKSADQRIPGSVWPRVATEEERQKLMTAMRQLFLPAVVSPEDRLLVDDFDWCLIRVVDQQRGYFKHHCQSLPGFSGAPILTRTSDGEIVLVGVHSGISGTFGERSLPGSNEAVILSQSRIPASY